MHWNECAWKLQLDPLCTGTWFDDSISSAGPAGYTPKYCFGRVTTGIHHMACWFSTLLTIALFSLQPLSRIHEPLINMPWTRLFRDEITQSIAEQEASILHQLDITCTRSSFTHLHDWQDWMWAVVAHHSGSSSPAVCHGSVDVCVPITIDYCPDAPIPLVVMAFTARNVDVVNRTWQTRAVECSQCQFMNSLTCLSRNHAPYIQWLKMVIFRVSGPAELRVYPALCPK